VDGLSTLKRPVDYEIGGALYQPAAKSWIDPF
jgi:hypothetical protein